MSVSGVEHKWMVSMKKYKNKQAVKLACFFMLIFVQTFTNEYIETSYSISVTATE